eukprot:350848-Chlamydomonas_euryale.AAC.10
MDARNGGRQLGCELCARQVCKLWWHAQFAPQKCAVPAPLEALCQRLVPRAVLHHVAAACVCAGGPNSSRDRQARAGIRSVCFFISLPIPCGTFASRPCKTCMAACQGCPPARPSRPVQRGSALRGSLPTCLIAAPPHPPFPPDTTPKPTQTQPLLQPSQPALSHTVCQRMRRLRAPHHAPHAPSASHSLWSKPSSWLSRCAAVLEAWDPPCPSNTALSVTAPSTGGQKTAVAHELSSLLALVAWPSWEVNTSTRSWLSCLSRPRTVALPECTTTRDGGPSAS